MYSFSKNSFSGVKSGNNKTVKYGWKAVIRNTALQMLAYICPNSLLVLINWEAGSSCLGKWILISQGGRVGKKESHLIKVNNICSGNKHISTHIHTTFCTTFQKFIDIKILATDCNFRNSDKGYIWTTTSPDYINDQLQEIIIYDCISPFWGIPCKQLNLMTIY